jgi:CPA2 family monovalent cation:H+ antiporter-2
MPHDTPLISTIVAGLVLAFVLGAIANRLRLPPLVGYLVAGALVGPHTPGFVADAELATELSEIGVILLMFGVGLHFSIKDLLSVRAIAIPGAVVQIGGATLMGAGLGLLLGWPLIQGLIFGLALSVASTVVLLRALQDRHMLDSDRGRIAVGWLIVEDVAMILALVVIPAIAAIAGLTDAQRSDPFVSFAGRLLNMDLGLFGVLVVTLIKLGAFVGFMLVVGRRVIPLLLHYTAHTGSRELFRLAVLAIALGVAAGSAYLFGVSLALGAFFAGMILSESELSHRAAQESLPLRDAFAVLFFVSVGMLFDPSILWRQPLPVLATLFIILIGKSVLAFLIVVAFRRPVGTALTISASLAQIGEFSFILATLGLSLGMLQPEARDLILAGAILSILLNPVAFWLAERLRPPLEARYGAGEAAAPVEPSLGDALEPSTQAVEEESVQPTALTGHTVLIGYGRVGTVVAEGLKAAGRSFLVIEDAETRISAAREAGIEVVVGNAAAARPLRLANIDGATTVIVAIPNAFEAGQAVDQCRKANASALIVARAHSDEEEQHLRHLGANMAIMGEREIGMAMLELINPDTIAAAAASPLDAVAAAIAPKGTRPLRSLRREPERVLSEIDEDELARAIGAPVTGPGAEPEVAAGRVAEPPPRDDGPEVERIDAGGGLDDGLLIEGEAVDVSAEAPQSPPDADTAVESSAPHEAEIVQFKPRRPATSPATPFDDAVPTGADTEGKPGKSVPPDEAS